ncbi:hypothetical protein D9758_007150 [Tetrapyrgos nigripes]|uniref:Uncharacterized protein n=1 Tax=Tetrapyrgos nigripes TaxID=182062 RepID=A0A8H5GDN4_9AGAR|nr:hypothetical protein D9758_007150 [Tetrapyrgos nigripes]
MPQSTPGLLFVDDTDPRLHYTGEWQQTSGSAVQLDDGTTLDDFDFIWNGKIWNDTVHETKRNNSMMTFSFSGTAYAVIGSFLFTGNSPRGRIDCFLDGNPVPDDGTSYLDDEFPGDLLRNNIMICGNGSLNSTGAETAGGHEHEIVLKIESLVHSSFFLDYILYQPVVDGGLGDETSPDQNGTDGEVMMMIGRGPFGTLLDDASEHYLTFSSGWQLDDDRASMLTRTPGAFVSVAFNGTGIQLYGDLGEESSLSNIAKYQLDDQESQTFPLLPPNDGSDLFFFQQLFNISGLSPLEEHTLVVTHNGTKTGMALSLDHFVVERASTSSFTATSSTPSAESSGGPSTGTIVGGTIGGVILLILLLSVAVFCIRRRRRQVYNTETPRDAEQVMSLLVTRPPQNGEPSNLANVNDDRDPSHQPEAGKRPAPPDVEDSSSAVAPGRGSVNALTIQEGMVFQMDSGAIVTRRYKGYPEIEER